MLRTPVGLAVAGVVLGGAVCIVVGIVKAFGQITEGCSWDCWPQSDKR